MIYPKHQLVYTASLPLYILGFMVMICTMCCLFSLLFWKKCVSMYTDNIIQSTYILRWDGRNNLCKDNKWILYLWQQQPHINEEGLRGPFHQNWSFSLAPYVKNKFKTLFHKTLEIVFIPEKETGKEKCISEILNKIWEPKNYWYFVYAYDMNFVEICLVSFASL